MYWSIVNSFFFRFKNCIVYEIYPRSETPHLIQTARLDSHLCDNPPTYLLPGIVIWYRSYEDKVVFRVWDYRLNHSISFFVNVDNFEHDVEVYFILSKALKLASNSFVGR